MGRGSRGWRPDLDDDGELYDMDVSGWIRAEFRSADLGDKRLDDRLVKIGHELGSSPAESIPAACEDWASTKATYRFRDNDRVEPSEVISAHRQAQRSRMGGRDELLVVSDTTYLTFPRHPAKDGLGDIGSSDIEDDPIQVESQYEKWLRGDRATVEWIRTWC